MSEKFILFLSLCICIGLPTVSCQREILKNLALLQQPCSNLMLTLRDSVDPILEEINQRSFPYREARLFEVYQTLQRATKEWQKGLLEDLKKFDVEAIPFWITNQVYVRNATPEVVQFLVGHQALHEIEGETIHSLLPPQGMAIGQPPVVVEWGVEKIGAVDVWSRTRGEGVIVGVIDSGVRATHNALRDNFVGLSNNGWYDPILGTPLPTDNVGHGTHCVGTICGNNGIGVAPAAEWMAFRGCDSFGCPQRALLACGQWMICPTDVRGENPDCSKAPHIVSNSWGGNGGGTWFNDVIKAWNTAGIIGFFAIGNDGPTCGTAASPGDQDGIISVGSTNENDSVSLFSSRGPRISDGDQVRPQITAPGENINSAFHRDDNAYQIISGTSMAGPNAAGAAALLLSVNPNLTLHQMEDLLFSTSHRNLTITGNDCGDHAQNTYPNDVAGFGRIDVSAAYIKLLSM